MRLNHIDYLTHYDPAYIIIDLNFHNFIKDIYTELFEASMQQGTVPLKNRPDKYVFDNFYMKFFKGAKPFSNSISWIGAKRIYTIMNLEKKIFCHSQVSNQRGSDKCS